MCVFFFFLKKYDIACGAYGVHYYDKKGKWMILLEIMIVIPTLFFILTPRTVKMRSKVSSVTFPPPTLIDRGSILTSFFWVRRKKSYVGLWKVGEPG